MKYYSTQLGVTPLINTEKEQREREKTCPAHCHWNCIEKTNTETHSIWVNPSETNIGQLGSMVRNVMRAFDVSLTEKNWAQEWCVDLHNIYSSKNISGRCTLEISEGNTKDI